MDEPLSLYDLRRPDLEEFVRGLGAPRYRSDQLWHWLYRQLEGSLDGMTNLPAELRARIGDTASVGTLEHVVTTASDDGSATKHLFRLRDGQLIETVLMHYVDPADEDADTGDPADGSSAEGDGSPSPVVPHGRHTVCISTQAGCAMGCTFCATGQMGLERNLTLGECVEQVVWCARLLHRQGERLTNVVFMGMGEPLANWPSTSGTIEALMDPDGLSLGARRITVSTVGIAPGIRRMAESERPVRLAVSIHAPDDDLRGKLVPVNKVYPLADVMAACRAYQAVRGRRITFEYVLIRRVNDGVEHAEALAHLLRDMVAHVNLIPLNPTAGSPLRPSSYRQLVAFEDVLRRRGVSATARVRRGIEIDAGCGQLRSRAAEGLIGKTLTAG